MQLSGNITLYINEKMIRISQIKGRLMSVVQVLIYNMTVKREYVAPKLCG